MTKPALTVSLLVLVPIVLVGYGHGQGYAHEHGHPDGGQGSIRIESVVSDSAAEAAGLQAGDRLLHLDGRQVTTMDDLYGVMSAHRPGDTVRVVVDRGGETIELALKFGKRPGGGVSIGVSLAIEAPAGAEPTRGTTRCLEWIDETYRIESMMRDLDLELADDYQEMLACVEHDTRTMSSENAIRYCDNVFKVHCSGLDLLTTIGEAQVRQCEGLLGDSLGLDPKQHKGWMTCAQHKVFDRYAKTGESSDEAACRAALLDSCGTNIDDAISTGEVSIEQRGFAECCAANALDAEDRCTMIDDRFARGPCRDRPVCVNRFTSEWLNCSVLGGSRG